MCSKEVWKPIACYETKYEVSNLGRVRSLPWRLRPWIKVLTRKIDKRYGYPYVDLWDNSKTIRYHIHKLVLTAFRGPRPDGLEAIHLDDVKTNCVLENLIWGTKSYNSTLAYRNGRRKRVFGRAGYVPPTAFGGVRSNAYHVIGKVCKDGKGR